MILIFIQEKEILKLCRKIQYYEKKYELYRGNDLQYNNYLRKLQKLSKQESLDVEGYKDYLEATKQLLESKDKVLKNLAEGYLNDLMKKDSLRNEIEVILKNADLANKNNHNVNSVNDYFQTANKDLNLIMESLQKSFENATKKTFKVGTEEHFTDESFKDLKNLRTMKLLIKLRQAVMAEEGEFLIKKNQEKEILNRRMSLFLVQFMKI